MDALIATAAADVAVHGVVDLLVGRRRSFRQQGGRLHDLAGLAVAALRHTYVSPGYLDRMFAFGVETFDCDHGFARYVRHGNSARADRVAVEMNRAGSTKRDAAAEFRSSQAELVAQVPQERHRRIAVKCMLLSVHTNIDHYSLPWR